MSQVILVVGGGRSGKSAYALKLGESLPGPRAFLATCPVVDEEMRERIRRHREARRQALWQTVEEAIDLPGVLGRLRDYPVLLVDCLSLWINNLMYRADSEGRKLTEEAVERLTLDVVSACTDRAGTVLFVSSEVGLGVIPETALGRRYRDLLGRCNQVVADRADHVVFMVCGLPISVKGHA
ncbi:MAG: bifunctional adenosylcobinamide kinase/adenosylcobinamide-phosphate guanylyltransferase [Planctomycetes bacterium]|nr:bifunctional adenosylcobinamide kinase/adenosylcobinamide-phosphate guanylyltransferase [Planctomycetota bacterium]